MTDPAIRFDAMNAKILIGLSLGVAFGLTGLFGGYIGSQITNRHMTEMWMHSYSTGVATEMKHRLLALQTLRGGDIAQATEGLERLLDADLISLSGYGSLPVEKRDEIVIQALKRAKEYRAKYPSSTTESYALKLINEALNLAD